MTDCKYYQFAVRHPEGYTRLYIFPKLKRHFEAGNKQAEGKHPDCRQ